jgi:hypothetical protein
MDQDIAINTARGCDEAEALLQIEPLDAALDDKQRSSCRRKRRFPFIHYADPRIL